MLIGSLLLWSSSQTNVTYLDGQRVQVDLLQGLDLHVLNQAAQLGDWNPLTGDRKLRQKNPRGFKNDLV